MSAKKILFIVLPMIPLVIFTGFCTLLDDSSEGSSEQQESTEQRTCYPQASTP